MFLFLCKNVTKCIKNLSYMYILNLNSSCVAATALLVLLGILSLSILLTAWLSLLDAASTTRLWRPSLNCRKHTFLGEDILNIFETISFAQTHQRKSLTLISFCFPSWFCYTVQCCLTFRGRRKTQNFNTDNRVNFVNLFCQWHSTRS